MRRFWNLMPDAEAPGDGVLDIEGPIAQEAWWGDECSSREFVKALKGVRNVTVHINSPGGDVMAGAEIYSALREHSLNGRGKVTVIITALAASAASVVAMAGDEILISPVAYMMIHNPWSIAMGDAKEMRKTAKTLDEISEGLITAYQTRTGKGRDELKRMLENETWMSSQRCVDEGFADGIYGEEIRASALASASMMTQATPEEVREMCRRWETARGTAEPETADAATSLTIDAEQIRADLAYIGPGATTVNAEMTVNGITPEEEATRAEIVRRAEIAQRAAIAAAALQ